MSTGNGRDGKLRMAMAKGQLSGKLAGLSLPRQIMLIATWPLLEQLLSFICASTSLFLAGHLDVSDLEKQQILAGLGVAGYITWLGFMIQSGVAMGATALVSRLFGARKFKEANHAGGQAAILGFISGLIASLVMFFSARFLCTNVMTMSEGATEIAVRYIDIAAWVAIFSGAVFAIDAALRGSGDTRTPFFVMLVVDSLNIIISLILVHQFSMGTDGLAWGLVGSWVLASGGLIFLMLARARKQRRKLAGQDIDDYAQERGKSFAPNLCIHRESLSIDWSMMRRIIVVGLPQAMDMLGVWVLQMLALRLISNLGDAALGAHNIAIRVESLSFLPGFAIGLAAATLVGQYLGSGSPRLALETLRKCVLYGVYFMGGMGIIFGVFPDLFVNFFASNAPETAAAARGVIQLFIIAEPFFAISMILRMSLRAAGDTRRVMLTSFGCMGFFRLLVLYTWFYIAPESVNLTVVWVLFTLDLAAQALILNRMVKGMKWARIKV